MKIEEQVASLELSKKLKSLGIKQESLWYWTEYFQDVQKTFTKDVFLIDDCIPFGSKGFSAFTVAELGEMLPGNFNGRVLTIGKGNKFWDIFYENNSMGCVITGFAPLDQTAETEANARAKMLVYLLENKLLEE